MKYVPLVQRLLIVVAFVFIAVLLRNQWPELRAQPWRFHFGWLLTAIGFMIASWSAEVLIWQRLLRYLGDQLRFWSAVRIWFLSAITRYVPGNIWQPLSMTMRCQAKGIRPETTIASVLLFQLVILIAAGPIAALYFGWSGNYGILSDSLSQWGGLVITLLLLPVVMFLLRPHWFFSLANWGLGKIGRPPLPLSINSSQLTASLAVATVHWFLWGLSFAALTFAINQEAVATMGLILPHLVASFAIAYTVGFLSFITPSGFGVREGVFVLLLAPLMGSASVTLAALAMRLMTIIGEVVMALVCLLQPSEESL